MSTEPIFNPMQLQAKRELEEKTKMLKAQFAAVQDVNIRTVPEAIFVRDFLPLFSGQRPENANELLDAWRLIAGTPFNPVNIVDPAGQKIIQIPPLFDANQIRPGDSSKRTMDAEVADADNLRHLSPRAADGAIVKALAGRTTMLAAPKELSPEWKAVLTHYKHLLPNQGSESASGGQASSSGDSLFEM